MRKRAGFVLDVVAVGISQDRRHKNIGMERRRSAMRGRNFLAKLFVISGASRLRNISTSFAFRIDFVLDLQQ